MNQSFKKRIPFIVTGALLLANVLVWQTIWNLHQAPLLSVEFFNVGQGDAIFIEKSGIKQVLIDGGPDSQIIKKLAQEIPFYDRTLDLIILTHPEKDHLNGLLEALKKYKIKNILWTGVIRDTPEWKEWSNLIEKEGANIKIAKAGERIILQDKEPKIYLDILNPKEKIEGTVTTDSNDTSIVSRLVVGNRSFLFTGDITNKTEKRLIIEENIAADVLKVAHHGSKYSSSEDFFKMISPIAAVISVGKNSYGHPTTEILQRLKNFSIEVLRTDVNGDIKFICDGKNIILK